MPLKKLVIVAFSVVVIPILGYGAFIISVSWPITFGNVDKAGVFGDSFGVLTALFSGMAFAAIFITILLQRKDITLQREGRGRTMRERSRGVDRGRPTNARFPSPKGS